MRTWKIALTGAILGAALILTVVRYGSSASGHAGNPLTDGNSHPATSVVANPIIPASAADKHGWGPVRATDW